MGSINPAVNALHAAFCAATNIQLRMLPAHERWWFDAIKCGMTPEDVTLVVAYRQRRVKAGVRHEECLRVRSFAGSDEAIANVIEEAAALKALLRVKAVNPAKAQVLRVTGRSAEPEVKPAQKAAVIVDKLIEDLRKSVK